MDLLPVAKELLDGRLDFVRLGDRTKTLYRFAVLIDEELGEIPLHAAAKEAAQFAFEVLEHRMGVATVHIDFLEHREAHAVIDLAKLADLTGSTGLLVAELVARETEHNDTAVFVLAVQCLEPFVLRCESAFAGGIDHEHDLSGVLLHVNGLTTQRVGLKFVKRLGCFHGACFVANTTKIAR